MLDTRKFGSELKKRGFGFYTGVPCSFLKGLINYAIADSDYVMAANEGDAIAIASGAVLGGRRSVCLMQNSGLTNAASPLTSLNYPFRLPVLGFVTLRGDPALRDEPQHELMGRITVSMLDLMEIRHAFLQPEPASAAAQLEEAERCLEQDTCFFFIVRKGTFSEVPLGIAAPRRPQPSTAVTRSGRDQLPPRRAALEALHGLKDKHTALLAATGKTGRELYEIEDAPNNLYMVGSMGCVGSLGLGLALSRPEKRIIAIDGDGALLMRMGSLATNGACRPANLLHVLLDSRSHDSTGGQATVSGGVDFVAVAAAAGYPHAVYAHSITEFARACRAWLAAPALTFLYLRITGGARTALGRPTVPPPVVKERLMRFLAGS